MNPFTVFANLTTMHTAGPKIIVTFETLMTPVNYFDTTAICQGGFNYTGYWNYHNIPNVHIHNVVM